MRTLYRSIATLGAVALLFGCVDATTTAPEAGTGLAGSRDVSTQAVIPEFRISTKPGVDDQSGGAATDGTNYLIGYSTDTTHRVWAALVAANGTLLAKVSTGRKGYTPLVAFDGTNYLLAWADQQAFPAFDIHGQLIDRNGAKVGARFRITTTGDAIALSSVCFGGGQYLVTYTRFDALIHRRFVSTAGVRGADLAVSSGQGFGFNSCASDGTDFLTTWVDAQNATRARLVRGDGTLGTELTVDATADSTSPIIPVAFMGGNYLVAWSDLTAVGDWNIYARLVTAAGAITGGRKTISATVGTTQYLSTVTANGSNFAAYYLDDLAGAAKSTVRFFSSSVVATGPGQVVFKPKSGRPVAGGPMVVNGTTYFFGANRATPGVNPLDFGGYTAYDLWGAIGTLVP